MSGWMIATVTASFIIGLLIMFKLVLWHHWYTATERLGLSLIGAGSIMTIGPILTLGGSPFANWAPLLLRVGIIILFVGHIVRYWRTGFPARRGR